MTTTLSQEHYTTAFKFLFMKNAFNVSKETLEVFLRSQLKNYQMKMSITQIAHILTKPKYRKGLIHAAFHTLQFSAPQIAATLNIKVETVYYHLRQTPDVTLNLFDVVDKAFLVTRPSNDYNETNIL